MSIFRDPVFLNAGKALIAVIMIISNGLLVFVTIKAKNLNSTCNWLIAANSACIALYSLTFFVQFGIVSFSPEGIPLWRCCALIACPLFFVCCQYVLFPLIAVDRLIAVLFPFKQISGIYKKRYMCLTLALAASFSLFIVAVSFNKSLVNFPENLVMCMTSDAAPSYFANCSWALNISSIVVYLALWIRVKILSTGQANETQTRRILVSLMVIFAVELLGWVTNWTIKLVLNQLGASASAQWYVLSYTSYGMQLSLAMNALILYSLNHEYRKAFQMVLGIKWQQDGTQNNWATAVRTGAANSHQTNQNQIAPN